MGPEGRDQHAPLRPGRCRLRRPQRDPFYGDLLGDWREEILAETGDHTALRLYTTTEPTKTRIYTLAQNPGYRLGWTVRGYLQSTYTDYYLGTETRRVPKPAITTTARTEGTS